jgi:hypothetical protein
MKNYKKDFGKPAAELMFGFITDHLDEVIKEMGTKYDMPEGTVVAAHRWFLARMPEIIALGKYGKGIES